MNKKVIIIGAVSLLAIGVGAYFYMIDKGETDGGESGGSNTANREASQQNTTSGGDALLNDSSGGTGIVPPTLPVGSGKNGNIKRKDEAFIPRKAGKGTDCGKKPLLRKNQAEWYACMGQKSSFDGFEEDMFSGFDNNFDL